MRINPLTQLSSLTSLSPVTPFLLCHHLSCNYCYCTTISLVPPFLFVETDNLLVHHLGWEGRRFLPPFHTLTLRLPALRDNFS
jgi:hypothetical protein